MSPSHRPTAPVPPTGGVVVGARGRHRRRHRQRDRGDAHAAPPEPAVHQHDDHGWRHRRAHRHAQVHRDDAQPRAPDRLGPRLVRRLPALHLLLRAARPLHRRRRLGHPLRRGLQVGDRSSARSCCRSARGPAAGSSGCRRRSRPCWPRPRSRSSSTTRSPSTAGTCSRRWPGSTPSPSACRWPCCSSGCSPRGAEGRHRVWAAVVLAGCVLSHIVPAMYALGGAVVLTVVELLPARWGIGDTSLLCGAATRCVAGAPDGGRLVGRLDASASACCSRVGGWCPSVSTTPTRPRWGTEPQQVERSSSPRPTPGPSSSPGSAARWPSSCAAASGSRSPCSAPPRRWPRGRPAGRASTTSGSCRCGSSRST